MKYHIDAGSQRNIKTLVTVIPHANRFSRRQALCTVPCFDLTTTNVVTTHQFCNMTYSVDRSTGLCHIRPDDWDISECMCYLRTSGKFIGIIAADDFVFVVEEDSRYIVKRFTSNRYDLDDGVQYTSIIEPVQINQPYRLQSVTMMLSDTNCLAIDTGTGPSELPFRRLGLPNNSIAAFSGEIKLRSVDRQNKSGKVPWRIEHVAPGSFNITSIITDTKEYANADSEEG